MRFLTLFLFAILLVHAVAGCAHYSLPVPLLESPETRGDGTLGRLELGGLLLGTDLIQSPTWETPAPEPSQAPGPPVPYAGKAMTPVFGFVKSLGDRWDAGIRFQPLAPLQFRVKYQFAGLPEIQAAPKSLSAAVVLAPGILLGRGDSGPVTFLSGTLAVPIGYRFNSRHLLSAIPSLGFASLSGVNQTAALTSGSISAMRYGAGIGHQYSIENFWIRSELDYSSGSIGEVQLGRWFGGLLLGFSL